MHTISVENYLKAIYHLEQREGGRVKTKSIADALDISLPSVTSMLKSLSSDDLVVYERYKGVTLSETGRLAALKVVRKHRLVELFLVSTLDYSWDEVHREAELLEHAVSDDLAARIEAFLDFPQFDPHGDPIPSADGTLPSRDAQSVALATLTAGDLGTIERVLDQDPELLRHLTRVGLTPGARIRVVEVLPFDGQMTLDVHDAGDAVSVSRSLSHILMVSAR